MLLAKLRDRTGKVEPAVARLGLRLTDGNRHIAGFRDRTLGGGLLEVTDTQCEHVPGTMPEHASPAKTGSNQEFPLRQVS